MATAALKNDAVYSEKMPSDIKGAQSYIAPVCARPVGGSNDDFNRSGRVSRRVFQSNENLCQKLSNF